GTSSDKRGGGWERRPSSGAGPTSPPENAPHTPLSAGPPHSRLAGKCWSKTEDSMLSRTICNQSSGKGLNWLEVIGPNRPRPDGKGSSHLYEYGWTLGYRIQPVPTHHSSILNHLETANWHE